MYLISVLTYYIRYTLYGQDQAKIRTGPRILLVLIINRIFLSRTSELPHPLKIAFSQHHPSYLDSLKHMLKHNDEQ